MNRNIDWDLVSAYTQKLTKKAADNGDFVSEADSSMYAELEEEMAQDYANMMGAEDVARRSGPSRGRQYFFMNLVMIIVLSLIVTLNFSKVKIIKMPSTTGADDNLNDDKPSGMPDCLAILEDPFHCTKTKAKKGDGKCSVDKHELQKGEYLCKFTKLVGE